MNLINKKFLENYYTFFKKLFNFEKVVKILPVDFEKPWWKIIWDQKIYTIIILVSEIIQQSFAALTPFILGIIILERRYVWLVYYVLAYVAVELLNRSAMVLNTVLSLQSEKSLTYYAYQFLLTADPIFHVNKSSGVLISKIQVAASDLSEFISNVLSEIVTALVGYVTIVIVLLSYDTKLGLIAIATFVIITIVNALFSFITSRAFKPKVSKQEDLTMSILAENLYQNSLIRASYAAVEQLAKTKSRILKLMSEQATSQSSNKMNVTFTRITYILCIAAVGFYQLTLIDSGKISTNIALLLLLTMVSGTSSYMWIGATIKRTTDMYFRIVDLFETMRNFGKQSYPVIPYDKVS